ncbi:MAG: alpha-N-arabinofuranosidase, partial [Verrucomicrobia bacterium]|nr:alpha-N-arabinofuranosidase [Verrucomicrobiota bacterium]
LLKELDAPIYRWPGGNFVSGYDWRDGLGDPDRRPTRKNPAWKGIEPNDFGMHEYIAFCREIGAEPLITVNTGFGDAYSAAAEVEYANGAANTPMGALRAKNGSSAPFKVKYWCIGNEMYGPWQLGHMALEHYVQKHNWVVDKMRAADAHIVTFASGSVETKSKKQDRSWSEGLLTDCRGHMDYLAEHFYVHEKENVIEHSRLCVEKVRAKAEQFRDLRSRLKMQDNPIRLAMTEWNYWYGPHVFGELGTRYFLKDGLGIAAGLHEFFRNSDVYFMANYAQTVNVIGCVKASKTAAAMETTGLALTLYRRHFGSVPVKVSGEFGPLDVAAALTKDGKTLTVGVVNPTAQEQTLNL